MKLPKDVEEIFETEQFTNSNVEGGKWVNKFETKLSQYLKKPTVCVNSGTSALIISLKMAGVKAGDEVIIPAYGFIATKNAVLALQAKPVYVDIDPKTYCMDVKSIAFITAKAVIITDLYGNICDLPIWDIPVIEDACQALGTIKKCKADYTCFSFYYSKIISAGGEGGAIACDDPLEVRKMRTYPDGINMRMCEINACIGYNNMQNFKGGRPENWYMHYDYTLSPKRECPNADYASIHPDYSLYLKMNNDRT